jgi:hypothetical protein
MYASRVPFSGRHVCISFIDFHSHMWKMSFPSGLRVIAHATDSSTAVVATNCLGAAISMDDRAGVPGPLPLRAELQQLFYRRSEEVWGRSRRAPRGMARPSLQSLEYRRLRPALTKFLPSPLVKNASGESISACACKTGLRRFVSQNTCTNLSLPMEGRT